MDWKNLFDGGRGLRIGLSAILLLSLHGTASAAEPLLRTGDVVEMSVTGYPELTRRATVDASGAVSLPLFGEVAVGGMDISAVRLDLQGQLPSQNYDENTPSAGRQKAAFREQDLVLDLVERPPVYVTGDVSQPGQQPYRSGITVRQVVSLAGGYDVMRLRKVDPFMDAEDLRSDYSTLWTTFAEQQAKVWRLEADLAGKDEIGEKFAQIPVDGRTLDGIVASEAEILKVGRGSLETERRNVEGALAQLEGQIETLTAQSKVQDEEIAATKADLKGLDAIIRQGLVQTQRVSELRRAISSAQTIRLQTNVELQRAQGLKLDLELRRSKLDTGHELEVQQALKDARVSLSQTMTRLDAVGQKLDYTSLIRSQLVRGDATPPSVVVHRIGEDGKVSALDADEDAVLFPGDVVDIALVKSTAYPTPR